MKRDGVVKPSVLAFLAPLAACTTTPPPDAEMAAARAAVSQAQPAAERYAPEALRSAQAKLNSAEGAMARKEYVLARRLAEQAEVDAKLASSMAENERSRRAVAEVNQGIETLKQQLERRSQ